MRIRVLIADPDETLLGSYHEYLSQHDFVVSTVRTALDCSAQLASFRPDILVLEPELPWGWRDGVMARMHEGADMRVVPVMLLSNAHDLELRYRVSRFPVNDFELKPVEPFCLARRLRRLVESNPRMDRRNGRTSFGKNHKQGQTDQHNNLELSWITPMCAPSFFKISSRLPKEDVRCDPSRRQNPRQEIRLNARPAIQAGSR